MASSLARVGAAEVEPSVARGCEARTLGWLVCVLAACDDAPSRPLPRFDAAPAVASATPAPPREGCARVGSLDLVETDATCVVKRASEDAMRAALKAISITLDPEPAEVVAGNTSLLTLTIKNVSPAEVTLYFEARPRLPGPRTDWSRVAGIPEPHPTSAEVPKLLFPITTTDSGGRDVDAVPTLSGAVAPPTPTLLAVHLRPNGKLTRNVSWWALRIPAPAPIVTLDGGHRYVPKTIAMNLMAGEYTVTLDLPFFGLSREERRLSTRVHVTRAPLPDGGLRRRH